MQITLNVPEELARELAPDAEGLSRAALEALALEGIRSGKLSAGQAQKLLGFRTTYRLDGFLKEHGIWRETTLEQVQRDSEVALAILSQQQ